MPVNILSHKLNSVKGRRKQTQKKIMKKNNLAKIFNKITLYQLILTLILSAFSYLMSYKMDILTAFLISGITSVIYTQLLKFSLHSKLLSLYGFPIRLIITAIPCAILVHKFHSNLIALFIGFLASIITYFICVWKCAKNILQ